MIKIKNTEELSAMRDAGRITAEAMAAVENEIRPGVTLLHLDTVIRHTIRKHGAEPSFLNYAGFPASACLSVNEQVIHGIPDSYVLKEGDLLKVDVGAYYRGHHGDMARTFGCGAISAEAQRLLDVTRESFFKGFEKALPGNRLGDVGCAIQTHVEAAGFSVVRDYIGHGVGAELHEDPDVPNYGRAGRGLRLVSGMTIAVEPMVNIGGADVRVLGNGWTVVTKDGTLSSHYENTIAVTDNGAEILTVC